MLRAKRGRPKGKWPEDAPESTAVKSRPQSATNFRREIPFTWPSIKRRNVNKHIVRYVTLHHDKYQKAIAKVCTRAQTSQMELDRLMVLLQELREEERKVSYDGKRDYAVAIDSLLASACGKAILYVCLQQSMRDLKAGINKRIQPKNAPIYHDTISDYLSYITTSLNQ